MMCCESDYVMTSMVHSDTSVTLCYRGVVEHETCNIHVLNCVNPGRKFRISTIIPHVYFGDNHTHSDIKLQFSVTKTAFVCG